MGATYTIIVANAGGAVTTAGVSVADVLPGGLTATAFAGTGWTCDLASALICRRDPLGAGVTAPALTLTVNVAADAPASVTNIAKVAGGNETNAANNTALDVTTIAAGPDLTITKTQTGSFTQGQTGATYTITVTNSGGAATTGTITVTDALPAGLTATAFAGTGWTCTVTPLSCTNPGPIGAGASAPTLTLTVNVAANAPASVTNTATVSGGSEVNTTNNTATNVTTIGAGPDLDDREDAHGQLHAGPDRRHLHDHCHQLWKQSDQFAGDRHGCIANRPDGDSVCGRQGGRATRCRPCPARTAVRSPPVPSDHR